MAYQALYRKWRPVTFDDISGQDAVAETLKNQVRSGRTGHAYLFTGTRGTGKTTAAKILARAVNCPNALLHDGNPCNECEICRGILEARSLDVFEIDAASNNGVDNIRDIREQVEYPPSEGKYKVYIIDEVHMLSTGAFNALLKTLEEPPAYVIFILATTDPQKVPQTILSRCQRYDFRRISSAAITKRLKMISEKEGMDIEDKALEYISIKADGSMRDALSILDQCQAYHYGECLTYDHVLNILGAADTKVYSELFRAVQAGDAKGLIEIIENTISAGCEPAQVCNDFIWYMRNILLSAGAGADTSIIDVPYDQMERLGADGKLCTKNRLIKNIGAMAELSNRMRNTTQKRVLLETELIRLCSENVPEERTVIKAVPETESRPEVPVNKPVEIPVSPKISIELEEEETPTVQAASEGQIPPVTPAPQTTPAASSAQETPTAQAASAGQTAPATQTAASAQTTPAAEKKSVLEAVKANWNDMIGELLPSNRTLFKDIVLKDERNSIMVIFRNRINFKLAANNNEENGLLKLREIAYRKYGLSTNFTARIAQPGEISERDNTFTDEELKKINFPINFEN